MVSFKKYLKLDEARRKIELKGLNDVPRGAMKVSTRVTDLPNDKPYGFWVDRSGNFKVVPQMRHNEVAADIIRKANAYLKKHGADEIRIFDFGNDPYDRLFENGWLRVVLRDTVYYHGNRGSQATPSQMKFLDFLKDFYDLSRVELKF